MFSIKQFFPRNAFEKEALIKSFAIFFLTIELFVGVITFLLIKIEMGHLKHNVYLKLVNYSYTFKGEDFKLEVVEVNNKNFYSFQEDNKGLYIIVPVPGVEKDAIKIIYPREKFNQDVKNILKEFGIFFLISTGINIFISYFFALYTIIPLRKAIRLITEVAADISHDMNTPITSLILNLNMLKRRVDDRAIKRMEMAINQLKYLKENLSRLREKDVMKYEEVNLKEIIEESLKDISILYPDISVISQMVDVKLLTDRNAIKRVIDNLIINAFKHNVRNGEVRVILEKDRLIVENTSKPVKDIRKIFERFYRESQRGTGLGLAIVKRVIEEMGWKVQAEYNKNRFKIILTWKKP